MTNPAPEEAPVTTDAPDLITVGARSIVDNAQRLGLTWELRLATVTVPTDAVTNNPQVICDGDLQPVDAISMVGPVTSARRVWVIAVPPAGNYIVGDVGGRTWAQIFYSTGNAITALIPQGVIFDTLILDWTLRDNLGGFQAANLRMLINNDITANYVHRFIQAAGATGSALTHTQAFGVNAAVVGVYATNGAAATRFGSGRIEFPAWNNPHVGQLGFTFESTFENGANDGWYLTGGGFYGPSTIYTSISLLAQVGAVWTPGCQLVARGYR